MALVKLYPGHWWRCRRL